MTVKMMKSALFGLLCSAKLASGFVPLETGTCQRQTCLFQKQEPPLLQLTKDDAADDGEYSIELNRRVALVQAAAVASGTLGLPASPAFAASLLSLEGVVSALERSNMSTKNSQGAPEKHLPSIALEKRTLTMTVPHVMDPVKPHFIEYMWLQDVTKRSAIKSIVAVKRLRAKDPSPPTLQAGIALGRSPTITCPVTKGMLVKPMLFCNLHGLWEGEPVLIE